MRLAALIVNYDSGAYALALAKSLREQWSALGHAARDLELAVVDNASPGGDGDALEHLAQLGASVERSPTNLGYGAGNNLALACTRGAPEDLVLVLNPDLALFPGALGRLLATHATLGSPGAVGPRAWLDPARAWSMPPNRWPTPAEEALDLAAVGSPDLARRRSAERRRHALREWTAREPIEVDMLSGACLLLSRAAIERAGGLFDERYPLYFEDTDLFRRLARAGLPRVLEPRAEIVHHWARSSGIERADPEPARRHAVSRAAYFARWHAGGTPENPATPGHADVLEAEFRALGGLVEAPVLELPHAGPWLVELAMVPSFPLAAAAIVDAKRWQIPERAWEWFYRGRYYVRVHGLHDDAEGGAWSFEKRTPARTVPLEPRELLAGAADAAHVPLEVLRAPPRGRVLALAPHADDEVLGCGGTLAKHARAGDPVQVVVAFDGLLGLEAHWPRDTRRREAALAATALGLREYAFLDHPEGHAPSDADLRAGAESLRAWIAATRAQIVYAPWLGEAHPDHVTLARALSLALDGSDPGIEVWGYEVWTPLRAERLVVVDDAWAAKLEALRAYASQRGESELTARAEQRARSRGDALPGGAVHSEAFVRWPRGGA